MKTVPTIVVAAILLASLPSGLSAEEAEVPIIEETSQEIIESLTENIQALRLSSLASELSSIELGAMSDDQFSVLLSEINSLPEIEGTSTGEVGAEYDIILQPGHYKRKTGATGAQGARVSEQRIVAYIVSHAAKKLKDEQFNVLVVPADGVSSPLKAKVFLSVHADGNAKGCVVGPSLAYKDTSSLHAMHAVGFSLARAFGYEYDDFMKDGYTANSAKYYMYPKVNADIMSGLLEIGELTCPEIEDKLIVTSPVIASNLAASLRYIVTLPSSEN